MLRKQAALGAPRGARQTVARSVRPGSLALRPARQPFTSQGERGTGERNRDRGRGRGGGCGGRERAQSGALRARFAAPPRPHARWRHRAAAALTLPPAPSPPPPRSPQARRAAAVRGAVDGGEAGRGRAPDAGHEGRRRGDGPLEDPRAADQARHLGAAHLGCAAGLPATWEAGRAAGAGKTRRGSFTRPASGLSPTAPAPTSPHTPPSARRRLRRRGVGQLRLERPHRHRAAADVLHDVGAVPDGLYPDDQRLL
jgi:hypothetical protein